MNNDNYDLMIESIKGYCEGCIDCIEVFEKVGCANEKDMGKKLAYINIIDYIEKTKKIWGCM